jgi:glycosyltransferase involved in cell wall biosynthesis
LIRERVVFVIDSLRPYGAERVALDLATGMRDKVDVVLVTYKGDAEANAAYVPEGVGHVHLDSASRGVIRLLATTWRLRRLLRRDRPLAVISFMPYANVVAAVSGALASVPVVATEHSVMSLAKYGGRERPLLYFAMRRYLRHVFAVVGVSGAVREDLVENLGARREKTTTIYNPVDVARIIESAQRGASAVPDPRSPDEFRIVMVGNLKRAKGYECAFRALALLPSSFRLYAVGDGVLRSTLQREARELGIGERVEFVGWQEHAAAWLRSADLVWVPSLFEGFGLVLVEAHVLGCAVIPSGAPGLAEVAESLGFVTVPVNDAEALAEATMRLKDFDGSSPELSPWVMELEPSLVAERYLALFAGQRTGRLQDHR